MSVYPAYTFDTALECGARRFFAALRQAAAMERERERAAILAASYPYMSAAQQGRVSASLEAAGPEATEDDSMNEGYLRNLRQFAARQGAPVVPAPLPETPDHAYIRQMVARLRAPGEEG